MCAQTRKQIAIAVFASGRGSNFQALCEAVKRGELQAKIECLVCNVSDAPALEIAKKYKIPVILVDHKKPKAMTRMQHESTILEKLQKYKIQWVVLAGYMRLLTPEFLQKFWDEKKKVFNVVNIHPSLLPAFPGVDAYQQAWAYGVKYTGATVHLVGAGLDDGPVLAQSPFSIEKCESLQEVIEIGLKIEHGLYPKTLNQLFTQKWEILGRRTVWKNKLGN